MVLLSCAFGACGQENPKVLFIPTASNDSESYFEAFKEHFGNQFKCNFDVLYLLKKNPQLEECFYGYRKQKPETCLFIKFIVDILNINNVKRHLVIE
jgi:hypothetical protein